MWLRTALLLCALALAGAEFGCDTGMQRSFKVVSVTSLMSSGAGANPLTVSVVLIYNATDLSRAVVDGHTLCAREVEVIKFGTAYPGGGESPSIPFPVKRVVVQQNCTDGRIIGGAELDADVE
jgi:hypothetical protein